jgi:hypothetical protein
VRVGFLHHLLFDRYGPWWTSLVRAAGAEVVLADPEAILAYAGDPALRRADALAFKLAIASALALSEVDLLIVPQLNPPRDGGRGSAQDPWIADLPGALQASIPASAPIIAVPAVLDDSVEGIAVTLLHRLTGDAGVVRRTWLRHRAGIRVPRPSASLPPAGPTKVTAYVAQPWWAIPAVFAAVADATPWIAPFMLPSADLRDEALRVDPGLIDTDAEVLGAVRRFSRSHSVARVRLLIDSASGSDGWLERRARALAADRLEVIDLRALPQAPALVDALLAAPRDAG